MPLFGSSGIRGVVGSDITPEFFSNVGRALGSLSHRVLVGRDTRLSGEMLLSAMVSGLLSCGSRVWDAGIVSTPTLARASREFDCGAVVTASHNPPGYNGVKFWNPDGLAFDSEQRQKLEDLLASREFKAAKWSEVGRRLEYPSAISNHMAAILDSVGRCSLKVVVDCGCGAASNIAPYVLQQMGCSVVAINSHLDGSFAARSPEPTEENLSLLKATVKATKADLGIAHDGDGDRMVAVDEKGRYVGGDKLLPIFALAEAKRCIVAPVDASIILEDILEGIEVVRTRVGDVYVGEEVKKRGADFGGEPSGTWIFPKQTLCPDGIYAAARLVELVSQTKLSKMVSSLPSYFMERGGSEFDPKDKKRIQEDLDRELRSMESIAISTIDGWRLQFEDGWVLVRFSGTEPKVRIATEARTRGKAKAIYQGVLSKVHQVLR